MAFRLFGIGSKKNSSGGGSVPAPDQQPTSDTEDSFTVVEPPAQVPDPLPAPLIPETPSNLPSYATQKSLNAPNYLDGIPFFLDEGKTGAQDLDAILARIEDHKEKINGINWANLDYDFGIEKTVIDQDISATIRRLHVGRSISNDIAF